MTIQEAIKLLSGKKAFADIGRVIAVDEAKEICDVEIIGKSPAMGARLSVSREKENALVVVPAIDSDVVVVWVEGVLPVVVMVAVPEKVIWRGVDVFKRLNEVIDKFNSHMHDIDVTKIQYVSAAGTPTPVTGSASASAPSSDIKEFK